MKKRISVTQETSTGRNTKFHDNVTGNNMTRAGFVRQIKSGTYDDYYVRNIMVFRHLAASLMATRTITSIDNCPNRPPLIWGAYFIKKEILILW